MAEDEQSRNAVTRDRIGKIFLQPTATRGRHRFGRRAAVIGALGLLFVVALGIGYSLRSGGLQPAPRLSIVVLPFSNLSNDPDQQYFADAVAEDLTTDLSRIRDMLVVSLICLIPSLFCDFSDLCKRLSGLYCGRIGLRDQAPFLGTNTHICRLSRQIEPFDPA